MLKRFTPGVRPDDYNRPFGDGRSKPADVGGIGSPIDGEPGLDLGSSSLDNSYIMTTPPSSLVDATSTPSTSTARIILQTVTPTSSAHAANKSDDELSRSQLAAAITLPLLLILFALAGSILLYRRRNRQKRQSARSQEFSKELGAFAPPSPRPLVSSPQLPMPPTQPALSLSINTRFNALQDGQPHSVNVMYYPQTQPQPAVRPSHRPSLRMSRKPVKDEGPPPPYMPRKEAPARLTEENLARQSTSSSGPRDDDAISEMSDGARYPGHHDDAMSVVSEISYRGEAPATVHQTV